VTSRIALAAVALAMAACASRAAEAPVSPRFDSAFWRAWGDGQAEIDGYTLHRSRYNEPRTGTVVAIFVTEPWAIREHVKADDGKHDKGDVTQVLKLNLVEDFQTGIYDYNLMTSAWTAVMPAGPRRAGLPTKIAFSAQEWCGTTYAEAIFDDDGGRPALKEIVHSYFDGESASRTLDDKSGEGGLVEDLLLVWARGLASPLVGAGQSVDVPFLPSLSRARLLHKPSTWTTAKLTRAPGAVDVRVPAGTFSTERVMVEGDGRTIEIFVEVAAPRRVVKLVSTDGTTLELAGSLRTPYWQKNHNGDEKLLEQLGLRAPAPQGGQP
jgi:hypothetical protein